MCNGEVMASSCARGIRLDIRNNFFYKTVVLHCPAAQGVLG